MIQRGATTTLSRIVCEQDLASAFGNDADEAYPDVLSTPAMLGLMERACADLMRGELQPGELSVGVTTQLTHMAPTPLGAEVSASATFTGKEGNLFVFDVIATDAKGKVGSGSHARAIVDRTIIEQRASQRR